MQREALVCVVHACLVVDEEPAEQFVAELCAEACPRGVLVDVLGGAVGKQQGAWQVTEASGGTEAEYALLVQGPDYAECIGHPAFPWPSLLPDGLAVKQCLCPTLVEVDVSAQ